MRRRQRTRTVVLALAACAALFWGAVDIVGVPAERLMVQSLWVSLGVAAVVMLAAGCWLVTQSVPAIQKTGLVHFSLSMTRVPPTENTV